jgi:uncharacterized membrane protein
MGFRKDPAPQIQQTLRELASEQGRRDRRVFVIACVALVVAVASLVVALVALGH